MSILENAVNQAIKDFDEIQATAEIPDGVPTSEYAEYQAQNEQEAYDEGYEAGKTKEWSDFWDSYQSNGNRLIYEEGFAGNGWTEVTFKPKYDIKPQGVINMMFYYTRNLTIDLTEHLKNLGVMLDTSKATNCTQTFAYSLVTRIPELNLKSATGLSLMFSDCSNLVTIDKIILDNEKAVSFDNTFRNDTKLKNISFEGVISRSINFSACPLTLESAISVIKALKNYIGTSNEGSYSITFKTSTWELLNADEGDSETGLSWENYIMSKGWIY